jgi:rRNA maturation endonuclease Nob1
MKKKKGETWFEFMDRAKRNGNSPTFQEELDRDEELSTHTQCQECGAITEKDFHSCKICGEAI